MTAYTWNNDNGGSWNTATNWTPNGIPGAADTALFDLGGDDYTVTGNASAASVTVDCDEVSFAGTLTFGAGEASPALSAIDAGFIDIADTADVNATNASATNNDLSFASGTTLEVEGLLVSNGGTLDTAFVSGPNASWNDAGTLTLNQLFVNTEGTFSGNIDINDGGCVSLDTSAVFGGGIVSLSGSGTLYVANQAGAPTGSFDLTGETINVATGGVLSLGSDPGVCVSVAGGINGTGSVDVSAGDYVFTAPNTYTGFTQVDTGGTLTLQGIDPTGGGAIFLDCGALVTTADSTGGGASAQTVVGSGGDDTVTATAGALQVFASNATSLIFQGGANTSTVIGGTGVLDATGGSAGDLIFSGSSGQDSLTSGSGPTTIVGGGGVFTATGAATNVLVAGSGNTTLNGGGSTGNNVFFTGGSGTTLVEGGSGINTILADGAANTIMGAAGTSNIFLGGGGTTALDLTSGVTTGLDQIVGFTSNDVINLTNFASTEAQTVLANALVSGGSTFLTFSDNTTVALFGFTGLTASNFG